MKILYISHYSEMLGANRSLLGLVEGMMSKGIDCVILCPHEGDFTEVLEKKNIRYEIIPFYNWADTFLFPGYWLLPWKYLMNKLNMPRLQAFAESEKPDIIHTNSSVCPIGAYLSDACGISHVWHIREFAKLHYNMRFFPSRNNMIRWMKKATQLIVISKAIQKEVLGPDFKNWTHIYNGVFSDEKVNHLRKLDLEKTDTTNIFKFLIIGLIHPSKHQMEALKAFIEVQKKNEKIELHIAGTGRKFYMQRLKALAKKAGITEKVIFHGFVKNPESVYLNSDAVLMCSRYEGMGRVTVEAMAYAKPVLGYHSGATPELIDHGINGFVYKNEAELVKWMTYLIENRESSKNMGLKGREKALKAFTVDHYVDQVYDLYNKIVEKE